MSARVLVAGVGNVFLGDDGFGPEVARRLAREELPEGVEVVDYGIRGVHLAFALLDPPELLILIDAVRREAEPGAVFVIEPETEAPAPVADAHGMDISSVFASVSSMGGKLPPTRLVGCVPADLEERMGLSIQAERAIEPAVEAVRKILGAWARGEVSRSAGEDGP